MTEFHFAGVASGIGDLAQVCKVCEKPVILRVIVEPDGPENRTWLECPVCEARIPLRRVMGGEAR